MKASGTLKVSRKTRKPRSDSLQKRDWVVAARKLLTKRGISNVKVEPLAEAMAVTTGSFYWHFSGRQELHDALLQDWYDTNTAPLFEAVKTAGADPRKQYLAFFGVWVLERDFDPGYDQAIRDWARTSKKVADLFARSTTPYPSVARDIRELWLFGTACRDARARHLLPPGRILRDACQGNARAWLELAPFYADILTGSPWMHALDLVDEISAGMLGNATFQNDWMKSGE